MKERIYVDVDTQHDFCDPKGALFVEGAPAAMDHIRTLIGAATKRGALLFGSVDSHDFTAWEFASNGGPFPAHCVKGTRGWLKMEGTLPERATFVPNASVLDPARLRDDTQAILFEKEVYSLFANDQAERFIDAMLARRGRGRGDVEAVVFGVATDYCVKAAALGLVERGFDVSVVTDAVAPVTVEGGRAALEEMRRAGCRLARTREIL